MEVFLILQILFDAVLLFGILFLFHFSINQQQKKREEFDIVKNIQIQEMKENLEQLLCATKQSGKEVSEDIQKKITEFDKQTKAFNENIKEVEKKINFKFNLTETVGGVWNKSDNNKVMDSTARKKNKFFSDKRDVGKTDSDIKKNKKTFPKTSYSIGFPSVVIKQVYKMIDGNKEMSEVVKETNLTRAEISLILNLRENRFTAPN
jgi:hypothetical protein